jgi:hypothetical protein
MFCWFEPTVIHSVGIGTYQVKLHSEQLINVKENASKNYKLVRL